MRKSKSNSVGTDTAKGKHRNETLYSNDSNFSSKLSFVFLKFKKILDSTVFIKSNGKFGLPCVKSLTA